MLQGSYFKKMFEGGFAEAVDGKANLPEDDAAAFGLFLEWLYTGICFPNAWSSDFTVLIWTSVDFL